MRYSAPGKLVGQLFRQLDVFRNRFYDLNPCISLYLESESKVVQSCPTLVSPGTVALQAPLSMQFSRQEYFSWLPFPSPGDLPHPGIELGSPALQADSLLPSEIPGSDFFFPSEPD